MTTNTTAVGPSGSRQRFWKWLISFWSKVKRSMPLAGNVSRHHYYEVRERYYQLKRIVDLRLAAIEGEDASAERPVLEVCRDIMVRHENRLTQRYDDLIRLSRALSFVRVLLIENVFSDSDLYAQQGVLREEMIRLKMDDSGRVGDILTRLAELSDEDGEVGKKRVPFRTLLRAGFERVNSIRVERIRDQWMHIRTYISALCLVVPTAVLMLMFEADLTKGWPRAGEDRPSGLPQAEQPANDQGGEGGAPVAESQSDATSEESAGSAPSGEPRGGSPPEETQAGSASPEGEGAAPSPEAAESALLPKGENSEQPRGRVLWMVLFGGFVGGLFSISRRRGQQAVFRRWPRRG